MSEIKIDSHLLQAAIKALGITAPIYAAIYTDKGEVAITTRDGVVIWKPAIPFADPNAALSNVGRTCKPLAKPADDLTLIPQVGEATQAALNGLGIFTFEQLGGADADLLLSIVPRRTLRCIVHYLQTNYPGLRPPVWNRKEC